MKYAGQTIYIVVNEGEILGAYNDETDAQSRASSINFENVDEEVRDAGYDPEELTDDEMSEFAFSAGFNAGWAYCEGIDIPEESYEDINEDDEENEETLTEESTVYTSEGDEFTYREIIAALDKYYDSEE